jgi:LAO/AO transport system kinase
MKKDKLGPLKSELEGLLKKAKTGSHQALSRLLSQVERDVRGAAPFLAGLKSPVKAVRLGITGPPGAGKSSLINLLIQIYRASALRIAVLAIDPSSPFSGGAILGDRVRMTSNIDENIFIRSIGSRGGLGGLSVATGAMASVLEASRFDIVIIETVGVGQTELQVMNHADATAVVLVPESGDVIQTLKAGILEIADVFVVNKSDRPGADLLMHELTSMVELEGEKKREIFLTSALNKVGVKEFAENLLNSALKLKKDRRHSPSRLQEELKNLVLWTVQQNYATQFSTTKITNVYEAFKKFKIPK